MTRSVTARDAPPPRSSTHHAHTSPTAAHATFRCAVYTRKSSEEGLDMAFNSLDAQREACLDYIKSQRHQGWIPVQDASGGYDDGGYSGGNTDRPGLRRLLADIDAGRVDIVVVYKVDRLSRSLADFARLMQLFEARNVSFVSVTQQFSTTTSMGRLTLNMLLSFAQFEREVAGERIRDKILATKRRGVWVAGQTPLGYRLPRADLGEPADQVLRIVPDEARLVRLIYDTYLETRSLLEVARRMNELGHTTRRWTSTRSRVHGGNAITPLFVYRTLTNPVFVGVIAHTRAMSRDTSLATTPRATASRTKSSGGGASFHVVAPRETELYPGLHEPIVPRDLWDRVQETMAHIERDTADLASRGWTHTHLLGGKLKDGDGRAISPSHIKRVAAPGTRATPYYKTQKSMREGGSACPLRSLNARLLDDLVRALVLDHLASTRRQLALDDPSTGLRRPVDGPSTRDLALRALIHRVVITPRSITLELLTDRLEALPTIDGDSSRATSRRTAETSTHDPRAADSNMDGPRPTRTPFKPDVTQRGVLTVLSLDMQIKKLDGRRMLVSPDGHDLLASHGVERDPTPNLALIRPLAQAHAWHRELSRTGETIEILAKRLGEHPQRMHHLLPLTQLGPRVIDAVLTGRLASSVTLKRLLAAARRLRWDAQERMLGMR
jgi:site-specific DNA recombinase